MAQERLADTGYCLLKKETTKATAVTPNIGMALMEESLAEELNLDESDPIIGQKGMRHKNYMGLRTYRGQLRFLLEPNTFAYVADMLLTRLSTTGSGPYTHLYGLSNTVNPNSYTVDLLRGQVVYRFFGLEARQAAESFNKNKAEVAVDVTARGCFSGVKIASVAANVLTLDTTYNPNPTAGLVAADVIRLHLAGGTTVDTTVTSFTATTVTVGSAGAVAAGDTLALRAQTPTLSILDPVMWARSEYRFGATASAALSAAHTPIEPGSGNWTIKHLMADDGGQMRSGSFDPASLVRTNGDVEIRTTQFFDSPSTEATFLGMVKNALVVRHFVGSTYEVRLTINNAKATAKPNALKNSQIIYDAFTWRPEYDDTDAQMFSLTVINNIATI